MLIRGKIEDISYPLSAQEPGKLRDTLMFHDGFNSREQVLDLLKQRFGTDLTVKEDTTTGEQTVTLISDGTDTAAEYKRYEIANTAALKKLIKAASTLFTGDDQTFQVSIPGEEEVTPVEGEEEREPEQTESDRAHEIWLQHATLGQRTLKLIRADRMATLLNVSYVHPVWRGNQLVWEVIAPFNIHFGFNEMITDGDRQRTTYPDQIEDATCVVIEALQFQKDEHSKRKYTAYVGISEEYPTGRLVTFKASDPFKIPPPNSPDIIYEEEEGNPWSVWSLDNPDEDTIEFPIMVHYGCDVGSAETVLPAGGTSMADLGIELDLALSRAWTASNDGAMGIVAYMTDKEVTLNEPYPNQVSGRIHLKRGQTVEVKGKGSSDAQIAIDNTLKIWGFAAENRSIPAHEVLPDSQFSNISGVALAMLAAPKQQDKAERVASVEQNLQRLFQIEKRACDMWAEPAYKIPMIAEMSWSPGDTEIPESETERITNIKALEDNGYIDFVEGVRRANNLRTRGEAEGMIEDMQLAAKTEPEGFLGMLGIEEEIE